MKIAYRIGFFIILVVVVIYTVRATGSALEITVQLDRSNALAEKHLEQIVLYAIHPANTVSTEVEESSKQTMKKVWMLDSQRFSGSTVELRDRLQIIAPFKRELLKADFNSLVRKQRVNLTVGSNTLWASFYEKGRKLSDADISSSHLYQADLLSSNQRGEKTLVQRSPIRADAKSQFALISKGQYLIELLSSDGIPVYVGSFQVLNDSELVQNIEVQIMRVAAK